MRKIEIQYFKFSTLDYSIEFKHPIVLNLIVFLKDNITYIISQYKWYLNLIKEYVSK